MNVLFVLLSIALAVLLFFAGRSILFRRNRRHYQVREVRDFLTSEECDHIIELAKPLVVGSSVILKGTSTSGSALRTSSSAFLKNSRDDVVRRVKQRVAELTETDLRCQESLQVTHYTSTQFYVPHRDALGTGGVDVGEVGDRYCTVIIYLNDDYTGGKTRFYKIAASVAPERGKAVVFYNLTEDGSGPHPLSQHGASPVLSGEKWLANQWIRQRPYGSKNRKARRAKSKSRAH